MKTSKIKNGSSEVSHKASPITPRSSRAANETRTGLGSANLKLTPANSSTERSPKILNRRSPKSPVIEKKRPMRLSELSSEATRLKEELKKTKKQLHSSESSNQKLQQEADEINKQLVAKSSDLNKLQLQFSELSSAEDGRLEILKKQHSANSAAFSSAVNEIRRLEQQLVMKSEAARAGNSEMANFELEALKEEMENTLSIIEDLESQNKERGLAEAAAKFIVYETHKQLEIAHVVVKDLQVDRHNLMESLTYVTSKLEESRVRVDTLEELAAEYQEAAENDKLERRNPHHKDQIRMAIQIRSVLEAAEKFNAGKRESELESAIDRVKTELSELKERFFNVKGEIQMISEANNELKDEVKKEVAIQFDCELKLMKAEADATELKAKLLDKEKALQSILEQNKKLNSELRKREFEAIDEAEGARARDKEALRRIGLVKGEAEKSKRAMNVLEQVEEAKLVNLEMETEIKKLKVQENQWRKAAETASAILEAGNSGGRAVDDYDNRSFSGKVISSPLSGDSDDLLLKMEKNSSVLRKLGGLWKKSFK